MAIANYDKTVLLLPMNGSNNSTSFVDCSVVRNTMTAVGDAKQSTAQYKYYASSGLFDGNGDYVSTPSSSNFDFSTGDFTIECWVYPISLTNMYASIIASGHTIWTTGACAFNFGSNSKFRLSNFVFSAAVESVATLSTASWQHIAVSRSGNNFYLAKDGSVESAISRTESVNFSTSTNAIRIGGNGWDGSNGFVNGYIQDLIVTKGVAKYTTNFTPPTKSTGTISGTIKDDTNANAVRTVSAIPRIANARAFSTTSAADGTYSLTVPDVEHSVIVLDDDAGTVYNDLIKRVTPI